MTSSSSVISAPAAPSSLADSSTKLVSSIDLRQAAADAAYVDLAPRIHRQRLVVEGIPAKPITREEIVDYLRELGDVTEMLVLTDPVTHESPMYGWAGWVHWETSGAHFYAWDVPQLFFSVDIYTCKAFDPDEVVRFTADTFAASTITAKSF